MVVRRGLGALRDPRSHISVFTELDLDVRRRFCECLLFRPRPEQATWKAGCVCKDRYEFASDGVVFIGKREKVGRFGLGGGRMRGRRGGDAPGD